MKNIAYILLMASLLVTGCSTSRLSSEDDLYYSSSDARTEARRNDKKQQVKTDAGTYTGTSETGNRSDNSEYSTDENGNIVIRNGYGASNFDYDDYYDYSYSARLRRFGDNTSWNYYDPYYTNMYWYNSNPYYYGNSIYTTYNFWGPSYGYGWSGYSAGYSWGYGYYGNPYNYHNPWYNGWNSGWCNPYDPWACNGWNSPWYNNYNNGYWNGFNNGMAYGNSMYYNSFDNNSYYYGPRGSSGRSDNKVAGNNTVSFSKRMQDNGISRDIRNERQPVISRVDPGRYSSGNVTRSENPEVPNNNGRVERDVNDTRGNSTTVPVDRGGRESATGRGNNDNTIIISNDPPTRDGNVTRSSGSTTTRGTDRGENTPRSGNNTTMRKWDNNDNNVIIIDRNNNQGQRSGSFGEGSRSSGNENSGFQRNTNPPVNNNNIQRNTYTPPVNNNNIQRNTYTPPANNNSQPRGGGGYTPRR